METDRFFDNGFVTKAFSGTDVQSNPVFIENYKYSQEYQNLMRQEGNQSDALNQYRRSFIQTLNLGAAICFLCVLIYRQN
jgi:hypothetical protein